MKGGGNRKLHSAKGGGGGMKGGGIRKLHSKPTAVRGGGHNSFGGFGGYSNGVQGENMMLGFYQ